MQELRKLVLKNKDVLNGLRTHYDKPDDMKELSKQLEDADGVLQVITRPQNAVHKRRHHLINESYYACILLNK